MKPMTAVVNWNFHFESSLSEGKSLITEISEAFRWAQRNYNIDYGTHPKKFMLIT